MTDPLAWMKNLPGNGSDVPTRAEPRVPSVPAGPLACQVAVANAPVTVFAAGSIVNVADILNPSSATEPLYVDLVAPALAGSATSIPLLPGQGYRISGPVCTAVSAVAATAGHGFVAVRY